jgi:hypothetical protein
MTEKIKAKRKLSDFNFDYEGAAVALVGPSVGGAANGHTTLLTKSLKDVTEEEVSKASEVQVTLNIVDFLTRFFNLWYEDAIVLAMIFGYETDAFDSSSHMDYMDEYEENIKERASAFKVMKSVVLDKDQDEIKKSVGELSPQDYLKILEVQQIFEKNFENATAKAVALKKSSGKPAEGVTVTLKSVTPSPSVDIKKEEDLMSEFISKAALEAAITKAVEDALAPVQEELKKAKEQIAEADKAKAEAVSKSRKEAIAVVEKDVAKAEELFKALETTPQEAFDVVLKSLKEKEEKVESSDLFVQKSKNTEVDDVQEESATAAILKAKYQKQ